MKICEKKSKNVKIRLNNDEYKMLEAICKADKKTKTRVIVDCFTYFFVNNTKYHNFYE